MAVGLLHGPGRAFRIRPVRWPDHGCCKPAGFYKRSLERIPGIGPGREASPQIPGSSAGPQQGWQPSSSPLGLMTPGRETSVAMDGSASRRLSTRCPTRRAICSGPQASAGGPAREAGQQQCRLAETLIGDRVTVRAGQPEHPPQQVSDSLSFGDIHRADLQWPGVQTMAAPRAP